jgi:organic hydroperoxide reductase OsmC/OhrA
MQPFPHRYSVELRDSHLVAPNRAPIPLGPPPQFGGSDRVWSPEELLVGATLECLWTTFQAYARRSDLHVDSWSGTGVGILDRGPRVPVFTSIELTVDLVVPDHEIERARQLLTTANDHCIIGNALNVPVRLQMNVEGSEPGQVASTA